MTQLLRALWASLVSVELARGLATRESAQNLSCFQCFKVQQPNQCRPIICQPDEKVCQSNEVLIYSSESFLGPGRLQGQWPHTRKDYTESCIPRHCKLPQAASNYGVSPAASQILGLVPHPPAFCSVAPEPEGSISRAQISKHCAVQCPNSNSQFEWPLTEGIQGKITRRCCSMPLCNRAPDTQKRFRALPGRILLPMGLSLFFTLL